MHAAPSTGRPLLCEQEKIKAGMRNKLREFRDGGRPMLGQRDRTLLVLLITMVLTEMEVWASWDQNPMEVLGDVRQLEASMHSVVLSDIREAEAAVAAESHPSGFPDSSAVVGRVFRMRVPIKAKNSRSTVKVRGCSFKMHCKCMQTYLSSGAQRNVPGISDATSTLPSQCTQSVQKM